jgi:hypothetical protein
MHITYAENQSLIILDPALGVFHGQKSGAKPACTRSKAGAETNKNHESHYVGWQYYYKPIGDVSTCTTVQCVHVHPSL